MMPRAQLIFTMVIQDSEEFGSDSDFMVSRVFFDLRVGIDLHTGLHADIKQALGPEYEDPPLLVSIPQSLAGSVSYEEFRKHVERYYRESFGSSGSAFRIGKGTKVRTKDNIISRRSVADIEFLDGPDKAG